MKFRPCIDIHNGKVKQIVGGSLKDGQNTAKENFVSNQNAEYYAEFYKRDGIKGGHIILLNPKNSEYYEDTKTQAVRALNAYPQGFQIGGGITEENAGFYLDEGASHVIVTSYVFENGKIYYERLRSLAEKIGKNHLVLDLSCRRKKDGYYIVTNRWQSFTDVKIDISVLEDLSQYCDEFLIHAVDVEGKISGIEQELVKMLGEWEQSPLTYAGGVGSFEDLRLLKQLGKNHLDVTIGSALDLFGGSMEYKKVLDYIKEEI